LYSGTAELLNVKYAGISGTLIYSKYPLLEPISITFEHELYGKLH
jgi:hypothetical protein